MSDPDRDRSINTMSWIAFILAAIAGLVSIIYARSLPVDDTPPPAATRSP